MNQLALCTSPRMRAVRELIAKVGSTNATVLLTGESGVGKEVVAREIHRASPRAVSQFLKAGVVMYAALRQLVDMAPALHVDRESLYRGLDVYLRRPTA